MKVTHAALCPTDSANEAGRPALTPELLAATGARYSRSADGLQTIVSRIDPDHLDKSVDGIFRMIDYGHQSIADMAPVALFLDGVSLWLAYYLWTLCPTAGGQETSTRYVELSSDGLISSEAAGIPENRRAAWETAMGEAFGAYQKALSFWTTAAQNEPTLLRIPPSLRADGSDKAQKTVRRMARNFAFDRARYFLPAGVQTNVMLVQSARAWVQVLQVLLSHPLPEARALGVMCCGELGFAAPRLLRHARALPSMEAGLQNEFADLGDLARELPLHSAGNGTREPTAFLEVFLPPGYDAERADRVFAGDLAQHDNRYAYLGQTLRRTGVRFGWEAVAWAEVRDLNRHRTGTKYCPLVPVGFYYAADELPAPNDAGYRALGRVGQKANEAGRAHLASGDATYVYDLLLGAQFCFEHTTTADKFLYEAELRTGVGAHPRYARHLRDALGLWYEKFPLTRGLVLEGSAEPE